MTVDARNEIFDHIELFDAPAMFTNARVDRSTVPDGLFCYDVRGADDDPGSLTVIEPFVAVNHSGTIIGVEDYMIAKGQAKYIATHINFLGDSVTLDEFCALHNIEIDEPKKGVLDTLKENKAKAAKQPSKPPVDNEKSR